MPILVARFKYLAIRDVSAYIFKTIFLWGVLRILNDMSLELAVFLNWWCFWKSTPTAVFNSGLCGQPPASKWEKAFNI